MAPERPHLSRQAPGCGFPILRVVTLFALSTGVVLEMAMGRYNGELTHEVSLFRQIDEIIKETDVFLADRAYAGWFEMAKMLGRGAHVVIRKHQLRKSDFRTGVRNGKDDHNIRIDKPSRPKWMSRQEYESYPEFITIREVRIRVANNGFRTRVIIVHTSLLEDVEYPQKDIALFLPPMACRASSAEPQSDHANGTPSLQEAAQRPQRNSRTHARLQSDPRRDC